MSLVNELTSLKQKIKKEQTQHTLSEGRLDAYMDQLEDDHGFTSVSKANKHLNKMGADIDKKQEEANEMAAALRKKMKEVRR